MLMASLLGIKGLSGKLVPLIRALSRAKKLFLSPLSRYWLDPCCSNPDHLWTYRTVNYLPKLGSATAALKEYVRDTLYTRHNSNFRFLCPNKILGIDQRKSEMPLDDARELAAIWGTEPVHPDNCGGCPEGPIQPRCQIHKPSMEAGHSF
jgi:hypothetical protein